MSQKGVKVESESTDINIEYITIEEHSIKLENNIQNVMNEINDERPDCDVDNENVLHTENEETVFYTDKGNVMSEIEIHESTTNPEGMEIGPIKKLCEQELISNTLGYETDRIDSDFTQIKKVNVAAFICNKCGKLFSKSNYLKIHSLICRYFKCDKCEKTFKTELRYLNHMKGHESCKNCGMVFTSKQGLTRHSLKCRNFKCFECEKIFMTQNSLSKHMKTHDYQFKCDKCKKSFYLKRNLAVHLENCDKSYETEPSVSYDVNIKCKKCKKLVKTESGVSQLKCNNLQCKNCKKPIKNESGVSWLKCNKCEKPIRTEPSISNDVEKSPPINEYNVAVHLKEHSYNTEHINGNESIEMPMSNETRNKRIYKDRKLYRTLQMLDKTLSVFKCDKCGLTFKFQKALIKHMGMFHTDSALTCKLCKKIFKNRRGVSLHYKNVHNDKNEA